MRFTRPGEIAMDTNAPDILLALAHRPDGPEGYSLYDTLEFYWRDQGHSPDEAAARADTQVTAFLHAVLDKIGKTG